MSIGEIPSGEEYEVVEVKFWFSKLEKILWTS